MAVVGLETTCRRNVSANFLQIVAHDSTNGSRRFGSAPRSRGDSPSLWRRHQAVAATIAALSVHMAREGRNPWMPSSTHMSSVFSLSSLFAATPPARQMPFAPTSRAAIRALWVSTSTTAAWNEAATSAVAMSGCCRTWFTTAVLSPENEKFSPSLRIGGVNATVVGSPV